MCLEWNWSSFMNKLFSWTRNLGISWFQVNNQTGLRLSELVSCNLLIRNPRSFQPFDHSTFSLANAIFCSASVKQIVPLKNLVNSLGSQNPPFWSQTRVASVALLLTGRPSARNSFNPVLLVRQLIWKQLSLLHWWWLLLSLEAKTRKRSGFTKSGLVFEIKGYTTVNPKGVDKRLSQGLKQE